MIEQLQKRLSNLYVELEHNEYADSFEYYGMNGRRIQKEIEQVRREIAQWNEKE